MERLNVILVIFDLCTLTAHNRKEYRQFRKFLINSGYSFVQESVYVKLVKNSSGCLREIQAISYSAPMDGNVMAIPLSLNDFKNVSFIRGEEFDFSEFSDTVVVI